MDFHQLKLFLAVMEQGSVTRAAEKVHLSPGAVSLQVQKLAADLRTDLFVRTGKQITPTPAAHQLAESARDLIGRVHEIEQSFRGETAPDNSSFHFATSFSTLVHQLGPTLGKLRCAIPETHIQVSALPVEQIVSGLLDRRFDLALLSLPVDEERLTVFPLFDDELLILRPAASPVRWWEISDMEPSELAAASFLLYPRHTSMRSVIDRFFRELGVAPKVIMELDGAEVMRMLVEAGFGYSILPESTLQKQPRPFRAFRVPDHPLLRRQVLAMACTEHPRELTLSIARFLQSEMAGGLGGEPASAEAVLAG